MKCQYHPKDSRPLTDDEVAELTIMQSLMYPSDVVAIGSAVEVLPLSARDRAAYEMAQRTKLMPKAYWPSASVF